MKTILRIGLVAGLIAGMGVLPLTVWAGEHGGKEHGGSSASTSAPVKVVSGDAAVLNEAAAALRSGQARPDLAAKLEQIAKKLGG